MSKQDSSIQANSAKPSLKEEHSKMSENDQMVDDKKVGFWDLPNDSILKTFVVALLLCLVCSVIVSGSATLLKSKQIENRQLDIQKNILSVAGLTDDSISVEERFKKVEVEIVDMATGEYTDAIENVQAYNQRAAAKDPSQNVSLSKNQDIAQIGSRAKYGKVYLLRDQGKLTKVIIPVKGYGLWSTLYGFIAIEADGNTIADVTFYEHNETPGLGGEIENREWQKIWHGKKLLNEAGEPAFTVVKGEASPKNIHAVDGLAGATLTAAGVMNLVRFWVGENGFGPYLKKLAGAN